LRRRGGDGVPGIEGVRYYAAIATPDSFVTRTSELTPVAAESEASVLFLFEAAGS
jgi:hypothetical protein